MRLNQTYTLNEKEIAAAFFSNDEYHQTSIINKCGVSVALDDKSENLVITFKVPMETSEEMVEEYVMNEYGDESNSYAVAFNPDLKNKTLSAVVVGKNELEE